MLKVELETLGKAWSKLEEQNSRKVFDLASTEEQSLKLTAEKTKLEQKVAAMTKQATSLQNMAIAQKRQSEKQLEQIRKLEELERSLNQQLVCVMANLLLANDGAKTCIHFARFGIGTA